MTAEIPSFEEKKIEGGKNLVVFYKMLVGFTKNNRRWVLYKRYSDFDALTAQLARLYPNLPSLPGKTMFKLSQAKYIEDRRLALDQYIKVSLLILKWFSSFYFRVDSG